MKPLVILCVLLCFNCTSEKEIDIQGHRGCRGLYPENSIPAFQKALELGVTTLELDVVISQDQQVVVSHEPFMNHEIALDAFGNEIKESEERTYNLYTMPYDSIKLYDCGTKVHPRFPSQKKVKVYKPLLSEVIALAEKESSHTIRYNIEIKSDPSYDDSYTPEIDQFVKLVLEIINTEGIANRITLQSFDIRALESIHAMQSKLETALLIDENESIENKLNQLTYKPDIISPYFKLLSASSVSDYQQKGFKIIPWTLNEIKDINLMIEYQVDGIISDFPDRVIQRLHVN